MGEGHTKRGAPRFRSPAPESSPALYQVRLSTHPRNDQGEVLPASQENNSPNRLTSSHRVFPVRSVVSVDPAPRPFRFNTAEVRPHTSDEASSSLHSSSDGQQRGRRRQRKSLAGLLEDLPARIRKPASVDGSAIRSRALNSRRQMADLDRLRRPSSTTDEDASESQSSGDDDRALEKSSFERDSGISSATGDPHTKEELVTTRFKHVVTPDGHAILTGREGDAIQRCEDEPIHIPGAIQGFGLLIALRDEGEGKLLVRVVSENSETIIGYSPRSLFQLENFADILSEEQREEFFDHLSFICGDEADPAINSPDVFILSLRPPGRRSVKLWCAMHTNDANPDLVICEFELVDDRINPLLPDEAVVADEPNLADVNDLTPEQIEESTVSASKPLWSLPPTHKRNGEATAMEIVNVMAQVQEQMASASDLSHFLKVLVGIVKELAGFHRVMIYQFDHAWNGRVVAELVDSRATRRFYKNLHFPASDIPPQARELYKINRVRLLYDRDQPTARLVCRTTEELETPLDLTYSYLRAMSPIHLRYLANMEVRSSMSISINAFNELWGLISCHGYGPKGMRVSFPVRKMCRLLGDSASRNIERLSYASRLQSRKLINTIPTEHNPSGYIVASSEDLLQLFDADFGLLVIRDETKILGTIDQSQEVLAMQEYLRMRRITSVLSSHDLAEDFPDLRYPPGFQLVAGLLLVPLSAAGDDFMVFFRRAQLKHVRWAGNPYDKLVRPGTQSFLEPRKSFEVWTETVASRCRDWTEDQIETAAVLCLVYGKFIAVWRQREAALERSQLTRLLLANSAHEVRTPLNAVINYLEIALEGNLDRDTREYLSRSHSASKSLVCVINDLLDLTKAETGQPLIKNEAFDLVDTVTQAADPFKGEAGRKRIHLDVIAGAKVPGLVVGDHRRVHQALSNLIANAIQHTSTGSVRVELALVSQSDGRIDVDIIVEDTGVGMEPGQLDSLFREMEQVQTYEVDLLGPTHRTSSTRQPGPGDEGQRDRRVLGLGLATVARLIRNMDGQLRLRSDPGKGSRFVMQLPFHLPADKHGTAESQETAPSSSAGQAFDPTSPSTAPGEIVLVRHSSPNGVAGWLVGKKRRDSADDEIGVLSLRRRSSVRSVKSDVDRLMDMFQEPRYASSRPSSVTSDRIRSDRLLNSPEQGKIVIQPASPPHPGTEFAGREPNRSIPGMELVQDAMTPLKAVRLPEEFNAPARERSDSPAHQFHSPSKARLLLGPSTSKIARQLRVLVAEDDPINSRIVKKRLENLGHVVTLTANGEDCASVYHRDAEKFDVILMDLQVC